MQISNAKNIWFQFGTNTGFISISRVVMKIYTQRLENIAPESDFESLELTFDTRQKSRFRATLKMVSILVQIYHVLESCVVVLL